MKNGVYYTDGNFYLRVDNEDASTDGRDQAVYTEAWKNGKLVW